ncbi:MAG TPA: hypothetical protein VGM54_06585 [Chthoniobacter sp.]
MSNSGDGTPEWQLQCQQAANAGLIAWWGGGTYLINGNSVTFPAQYHLASAGDSDGDGIPDDLDPYPNDSTNNTFYWNGGTYTINNSQVTFSAGYYAGEWVDSDGDGIPDSLDPYPYDANNGNSSSNTFFWNGGTFLINNSYVTWGPGYYSGSSVDSDGDGIPDGVDPYPNDPNNGNGGGMAWWLGGTFWIDGAQVALSGGNYSLVDSDGDGIPDAVDPYPNDPNNNTAWWGGGTFMINGNLTTLAGQYHRANAGDFDSDGIPDDLDPYPNDPTNNSYWWSGGYFTINNANTYFPPQWMAGNGADSDGDGIPDTVDPYPSDANNGNSGGSGGGMQSYWNGGTFLINGQYSYFPPQWYSGSSTDSDGDGIPDVLDPYPNDPWNNTYFTWSGGTYWIDGQPVSFSGGTYGGLWSDRDGDGIPDVVDPYPDDPNNNTATWQGGTFMINGQWATLAAQPHRANAGDADQDGIPDDIDPYPQDPTNNSFYWSGGTFKIDNTTVFFPAQYYAGTAADADGDGIPDVLDPYPNDPNNNNNSNTFWWAGGTFTINNAPYTFNPGWYPGSGADSDGDGIPDSVDPYPNDPTNNVSGSATQFYWGGGAFFINNATVVFPAQWYSGTFADSDGDGIPDTVDPYPNDPVNGNTNLSWWNGGTYKVNGIDTVFPRQCVQSLADSDGDGIPDEVDPYPNDPSNNSQLWPGGGPFWWNGQANVYLSPAWHAANALDSDADGIPDDLDPWPNDPYNNTYYTWPSPGTTATYVINNSSVTFYPTTYGGIYSDGDNDGIPDPADPYPTDPNNGNSCTCGRGGCPGTGCPGTSNPNGCACQYNTACTCGNAGCPGANCSGANTSPCECSYQTGCPCGRPGCPGANCPFASDSPCTCTFAPACSCGQSGCPGSSCSGVSNPSSCNCQGTGGGGGGCACGQTGCPAGSCSGASNPSSCTCQSGSGGGGSGCSCGHAGCLGSSCPGANNPSACSCQSCTCCTCGVPGCPVINCSGASNPTACTCQNNAGGGGGGGGTAVNMQGVLLNNLVFGFEKVNAGFTADYVVNDYPTYEQITGHSPDGLLYDPSKSMAENDWDGDGISNIDEFNVFQTDPRDPNSKPTTDQIVQALLEGKCSVTTRANFLYLIGGSGNGCTCGHSGCPTQTCSGASSPSTCACNNGTGGSGGGDANPCTCQYSSSGQCTCTASGACNNNCVLQGCQCFQLGCDCGTAQICNGNTLLCHQCICAVAGTDQGCTCTNDSGGAGSCSNDCVLCQCPEVGLTCHCENIAGCDGSGAQCGPPPPCPCGCGNPTDMCWCGLPVQPPPCECGCSTACCQCDLSDTYYCGSLGCPCNRPCCQCNGDTTLCFSTSIGLAQQTAQDHVGDYVSSINNNGIHHFVSPKLTTNDSFPDSTCPKPISDPYVVVTAQGISAADFQNGFEWVGNGDGSMPDPSSPLNYLVDRSNTHHAIIQIKARSNGKVVDTLHVWIVWVTFQAVITGNSIIDSTETLGVQSHRDPADYSVHAGIDWIGTIYPPTIITGSERPAIEKQQRQNIPGAKVIPKADGGVPSTDTSNTDKSGRSFSGWDVSRRNASRSAIGANLANGPGWNYPINDPLYGNDDKGVKDEDDDPYHADIGTVGQIVSNDYPGTEFQDNWSSSPSSNNPPVDGDRYRAYRWFQEFARVQLGNTWFLCSDYKPWRFWFFLIRQNGQWQAEGIPVFDTTDTALPPQ